MTLARRFAALGVAALLALQFLWHAFLLPPAFGSRWLIAGLFSLPLLPSLLLLLWRKPSAQFWGGVAALFYFCHGIAESWAIPEALPLAVLEVALSVWVILAGSWDGMKARFSKRK